MPEPAMELRCLAVASRYIPPNQPELSFVIAAVIYFTVLIVSKLRIFRFCEVFCSDYAFRFEYPYCVYSRVTKSWFMVHLQTGLGDSVVQYDTCGK